MPLFGPHQNQKATEVWVYMCLCGMSTHRVFKPPPGSKPLEVYSCADCSVALAPMDSTKEP